MNCEQMDERMSTITGDWFSQVLTGPVEILMSWFFFGPKEIED